MKTFFFVWCFVVAFSFLLTSCHEEMSDLSYDNYSFRMSDDIDGESFVDGECVIGTIMYISSELGIYNTREKIIKEAQQYIVKDVSGQMIGMLLNSEDWYTLLGKWFKVTRIKDSAELMASLNKEEAMVAARIDINENERRHAVIVREFFPNYVLSYNDPLDGSLEYVHISATHDPALLERKN